jgi:hypothetical protein
MQGFNVEENLGGEPASKSDFCMEEAIFSKQSGFSGEPV